MSFKLYHAPLTPFCWKCTQPLIAPFTRKGKRFSCKWYNRVNSRAARAGSDSLHSQMYSNPIIFQTSRIVCRWTVPHVWMRIHSASDAGSWLAIMANRTRVKAALSQYKTARTCFWKNYAYNAKEIYEFIPFERETKCERIRLLSLHVCQRESSNIFFGIVYQ